MCLFILFASSNLRVKPKLGFEKKPLKCLLEETIPIPNPFGPKIMTSGESSRDDEFRSSNLTISPPSKQQKVRVSGVEETLDRLSELPDSLLVPILSLLPTEDAFATCILSKRWRYLCTLVDKFSFNCRDYLKVENPVSFADYVLAHSLSPKIKKLELDCSERYVNWSDSSILDEHLSQISRCLSFAVEKKSGKCCILVR